VITKDGTIFYVRSDFSILSQTVTIDVASSGEQGLLNIAADPNYASNFYIYIYFTDPSEDKNQVDRLTVSVDKSKDTFTVSDRQTIIEFSKSGSNDPGTNHDGGGLVFENEENLFIGVGDGGGLSSSSVSEGVSQNITLRLGKILRIVPSRVAGTGGFSIPDGGNNEPSGALPEIYAIGLRNPFTITMADTALVIGDVGADSFEEINIATQGGQNFGWPDTEGETTNPSFTSPIHVRGHDDTTFSTEDPEDNPTGVISIIVGVFYDDFQYGGSLNNLILYSDFFEGWVRGLKLNSDFEAGTDSHLGHFEGLTSMQIGPNGFIYAVSLFGSDQIFKVELSN